MKYQRIALYGGTFDPIHNGHTTVAKDAAQQLNVDKLVFIPAKQSPLKTNAPRVSNEARVEMIRLATQDEVLFSVDTCELNRSTPSYTLNTIQYFRDHYGVNTALYWLMGADGTESLAQWYRIETLMQQCTIVTMIRGGCTLPDFTSLGKKLDRLHVKKLEEHLLQTPNVPISSTNIRQRLREKRDVSNLLHPDVIRFIRNEKLYE